MITEKEILSIQGEEQSKRLSNNIELQNLDVIWSSNYTRAKATAKYIAYKNKLQYNLDKRLCERKLGNLEDLARFMTDKETRDPSREQLAFPAPFLPRSPYIFPFSNSKFMSFNTSFFSKFFFRFLIISFILLLHLNLLF